MGTFTELSLVARWGYGRAADKASYLPRPIPFHSAYANPGPASHHLRGGHSRIAISGQALGILGTGWSCRTWNRWTAAGTRR